MASASGYNHHRFARAVLKKSRRWEPSLTVQLYPSSWKFAESPLSFTYDGQMRPFLLALRSQVIPSALIPFLYDIQPPVAFVDGCLVVEIQDFRRVPECRSRVVMRPAAESLAQTIDHMLERRGEPWDEQVSLELESRIIAVTSAPLYLGTSILATRNAVLSMALTSPATPGLTAEGHLRSPQSAAESSTSASDRMRKLLRAGGAGAGGFVPNWSILRLQERIENRRLAQEAERAEREARAQQGQGQMFASPIQHGIGGMANGDATVGGGGGGDADGDQPAPPKKKKKKRPVPQEPEEEAPAPAPTVPPPAKKKKGKQTETPEKPKAKEAAPVQAPAEEPKPKKKAKKKVKVEE